MKKVLSLFTFGIGALCFVVFLTVFKPDAVSAVAGTSKREYLAIPVDGGLTASMPHARSRFRVFGGAVRHNQIVIRGLDPRIHLL